MDGFYDFGERPSSRWKEMVEEDPAAVTWKSSFKSRNGRVEHHQYHHPVLAHCHVVDQSRELLRDALIHSRLMCSVILPSFSTRSHKACLSREQNSQRSTLHSSISWACRCPAWMILDLFLWFQGAGFVLMNGIIYEAVGYTSGTGSLWCQLLLLSIYDYE